MLDWFLAVAILGLLAVLAARLDRVETKQISGLAVINDGDSITLGVDRIRLRGIDAPEYGQICQRDGADYACGRKSREALVSLVARQPVSCSGRERDRYGRLLGACKAGGVELNRALVEAGWAVAYGDFDAEERLARQQGRGLWAGKFDRPRTWRDSHGGLVERDHDYLGTALNWLREIFRFF